MGEMVSIVQLFGAVEVLLLLAGVFDLREDVTALFVLLHRTYWLLWLDLLLVFQVQHDFTWSKRCF